MQCKDLSITIMANNVDSVISSNDEKVAHMLSIATFNCRGFNFTKSSYIDRLLSSCDVLFLQEHWLSDSQLFQLGKININFSSHAICGFDNNEVLSGRPYGGCAILWRSDILVRVETIHTNSRRVCSIKMCSDIWSILFINVYMPYEDGDEHYDDFCVQLSIIDCLISQNTDCHIVIGGDFNVDLSRNWAHTKLLVDFCDNLSLEQSIRHTANRVDYTYNFNNVRFNVFDYFIMSGVLFEHAVLSIDAIHDGDNLSDHDPVFMKLCLESKYVSLSKKIHVDRIAWHKANDSHLSEYRKVLDEALKSIIVPASAVSCHNPMCDDAQHSIDLNTYANLITEVCIESAKATIPHTGWVGKKPVPGWSEHVEPVRQNSIFWHKIWIECGRPKTGIVADIMRRTRASYHYAIRSVKRNEHAITRQRFAESVLNGNNRDLWSEVKRINGASSAPASTVNGQSSPDDIACIFADKYQELYNSVPYNINDMNDIRNELTKRISSYGYTEDCCISQDDVIAAICKLKPNKNDGGSGLNTNHFKHGSIELAMHTANLFSGLLTHGSAIDDFCVCSIVPIPKARNANLTDSENYRGIALSSIFGRIFDLIVLHRYSNNLTSCDLQFGFKKNRSTAMCSMIAKEVIAYYVNSNSNVHCVFLDSSKAFDKVEYCKLFNLMLDRHISPHVIRVLLNMYTGQQIKVLWNGVNSRTFQALNGVKQGAIISPILFCIYLDTLLLELKKAGLGCHIGHWFVAALAYADDLVLLAPTARAMRSMLAICDKFASEFNVTFNGNKSKYIRFNACIYRHTSDIATLSSRFVVGGHFIENVLTWSHLGHLFSANLLDDNDILARRNSFIGQTNTFLCNFSKVDVSVRNMLFKSYCSSHYGAELWDLTNRKIEDYCVAWRKGLRKVWKLPYDSSSSNVALVSNTVPLLDELCRRVMNFIYSCLHCDSNLVRSIVLHGIAARSSSPIGRNAAFCSLRYNMQIGSIGDYKLTGRHCFERYTSKLNIDALDRATALREIIYVREGLYQFSDNNFSIYDADSFIRLLAC